jgi:hypothetical protein
MKEKSRAIMTRSRTKMIQKKKNIVEELKQLPMKNKCPENVTEIVRNLSKMSGKCPEKSTNLLSGIFLNFFLCPEFVQFSNSGQISDINS